MDVEEQFARSFKILSPRHITIVIGMYKYVLAFFHNYTWVKQDKPNIPENEIIRAPS